MMVVVAYPTMRNLPETLLAMQSRSKRRMKVLAMVRLKKNRDKKMGRRKIAARQTTTLSSYWRPWPQNLRNSGKKINWPQSK